MTASSQLLPKFKPIQKEMLLEGDMPDTGIVAVQFDCFLGQLESQELWGIDDQTQDLR